VGGTTVRVGGMAKGSGIIHPNMATMLGVITTDALVESDIWRKMVKVSVNQSFNQITMGIQVLSESPSISSLNCNEAAQLQACLDAVMQGLAKSIAWDGEGATCLIEVTIKGTETEADAAKIARSVASSSLVKGRTSDYLKKAGEVHHVKVQPPERPGGAILATTISRSTLSTPPETRD
ncbi:hypothetical protein AALP_AAs44905U000100, partial [Arabis alpina]